MTSAYDERSSQNKFNIETRFRRIKTPIPVPESIPIIEELRRYEPQSMSCQPPVVWDRAEGFQVYDRWGNVWIDWSSAVLIANAGHSRREVVDAIIKQTEYGLLTNYCFPSEIRAELARRLVEIAPRPLDKAFLLSTGSETVECAIKLARTAGISSGGNKKICIVSFERAFHGRTLGAQMVGGIPQLKEWIINLDPAMVQVPFPDGFRTEDTSFNLFERSLASQGIKGERVAGVIMETFQGGGASFAPNDYVHRLRDWCDSYGALLIFDEVQAGFGRTGKLFGFEHYGVVPDLACLGKGISGSLPLAAVLGRSDILDLCPPGSMTSTHTGNPVCAAAALANIEIIINENLSENSARVGAVLHRELNRLREKFTDVIGAVHGKGLVAGAHIVKPGSKEPDGKLANDIVQRAVQKGLLMFSPVGFGGATVKICPPLVITEEAILDGASALEEAIEESLQQV